MEIKTVGIDLAKNVLQIYGMNERGYPLLRKQLKRDQVAVFFANLPHCLIGIEAYSSAHYWARKLEHWAYRATHGPTVRQALCQEQQK